MATSAGQALRQSVDAMTDALAGSPVATLAEEEVANLYDARSECAAQIQSSGVLPFPNPMGLPQL